MAIPYRPTCHPHLTPPTDVRSTLTLLSGYAPNAWLFLDAAGKALLSM